MDDDFAELAAVREDDEALDAVKRSALEEIKRTRQALRRLDEGRYGIFGCGEAIAPARLAALPAATFCIECAARV
ncbi:MAG TPA: TraR/DksA C4-type zinc finger protein [Sphingobium sp.]|nr:TraR/DksA C4-type zinc finger protein [Sphingobium sp.]